MTVDDIKNTFDDIFQSLDLDYEYKVRHAVFNNISPIIASEVNITFDPIIVDFKDKKKLFVDLSNKIEFYKNVLKENGLDVETSYIVYDQKWPAGHRLGYEEFKEYLTKNTNIKAFNRILIGDKISRIVIDLRSIGYKKWMPPFKIKRFNH